MDGGTVGLEHEGLAAGVTPWATASRWPIAVPAGGRLGGRRSVLRRPAVRAFALYLLLSLTLTGWRWLAHPSTACACQGTDPDGFMWMLAWWPFAILHGLNPFHSDYAWYPVGVNLAKLTSVPTLAIAFSPVTELFGPQVSYNLITLLSPALSAFAAFLLCRRVAGRAIPSVVGGFLFGFGAYEFPQLVGHPNLAFDFLIPLMVLLVLRRLAGEVSRRYYLLWMAVLLVAQLGISTEVLTTAVLVGFAMLLAATFLAGGEHRRRIDTLVGETMAAGWLAALVAAPLLYYALVQGGVPSETIGESYGLNLLNPVFPTLGTWLGGAAFHTLTVHFEEASFAESNGYLSVPIIAAFVWWTARTQRRVLARLLIAAAALSFVVALGGHLHVAGNQTIPLPYLLIKNLPVIRQLTPSRIAMYASLAVAVGIAVWLAEARAGTRETLVRWLVAGVGVFAVFPNLGGQMWGAPPPAPAFFRDGSYRRYLQSGETALALPFAQNGITTAWQAACGFCFRMPGAYLGHGGPSQITSLPIVNELGVNQALNMTLLAQFVAEDNIRDIIVEPTPGTTLPYITEFERYGLTGSHVGGVIDYRVPPAGIPARPPAPRPQRQISRLAPIAHIAR